VGLAIKRPIIESSKPLPRARGGLSTTPWKSRRTADGGSGRSLLIHDHGIGKGSEGAPACSDCR
jgi:hypothetical protein